ncbi:MAG: amino acid permease, partial [Leuconostoc lactis]
SIGVIIGQDPASFSQFNLEKLAVTYLSVPLFVVLYVGYKIRHKTHIVKLEDVDLTQQK